MHPTKRKYKVIAPDVKKCIDVSAVEVIPLVFGSKGSVSGSNFDQGELALC